MPCYVYDCSRHVSELFFPMKSGQLWPSPTQVDAPRQIRCLMRGCKRMAARIIVPPYVNDDLPMHDQLFRELIPFDKPTRAKWEKDGKVVYENGLPRGRARSRSEFARMLKDLGRCTPYEGLDGGESEINLRSYEVKQRDKKAFREIARGQAEKIVKAARMNPHGACGMTAKQIVAARAKKEKAIRVS